ncbi:MAG: hypothetical protein WKG32_10260 [Gemmatimonadaceae bacterium]
MSTPPVRLGRVGFWTAAVWQPWKRVLVVVYAVLSFATWARDELLPPGAQQYTIFRLWPHWSWAWWVAITCALLTVLLFEGAYRLYRRSATENVRLRQELVGFIEAQHNPKPLLGEINVPQGFKAASARYMAERPGIEEDLNRCRSELEHIRKVLQRISTE